MRRKEDATATVSKGFSKVTLALSEVDVIDLREEAQKIKIIRNGLVEKFSMKELLENAKQSMRERIEKQLLERPDYADLSKEELGKLAYHELKELLAEELRLAEAEKAEADRLAEIAVQRHKDRVSEIWTKYPWLKKKKVEKVENKPEKKKKK